MVTSKSAEVGDRILKVTFCFILMEKDFKPRTNPVGKRYGRLLVTGFSHKVGRLYYYNCLCDCGKEVVKSSTYLFHPQTFPHQSCGCWHREVNIKASQTHKMSKTPTYKTWCEIKHRCYNPNCSQYKNYGARGIKMCDRWFYSYESFLEDMGERPEGMSIDRIDVNGDYEPSNCRWADLETQCNNRRNNICIEYNGETKTLMQWCDEYKMDYVLVRTAYHRGRHSFEELIDAYKNHGRLRYKK